MITIDTRSGRVTVADAWNALGVALGNIDANHVGSWGRHRHAEWAQVWTSPADIGVTEPAWTTAYDVAKAAHDLRSLALAPAFGREAALRTWVFDQALALRELLVWSAAPACVKMCDGAGVYQRLTEATLWEFMRRRS